MADRKNAEGGNQDGNEEDYDPAANRPGGPQLSDFATVMHMLKCAMGTGILFLPNAFRRTGYVMSIVCGILMCVLCIHTATVLVRCSQTQCRRNRVPMLNYAQTAEISVLSGPMAFRKYAKKFGLFTNIFICIVHLQTAVIYILYVATSSQQVIEFFSGYKMDIRIYVIIFFPLTCAAGMIPTLRSLTVLSVLGFVFLTVGILITVYYLVDEFPDPGRLNAFTHVLAVPMYCSIFLFALHNFTLYLPLENKMKHPDHLPTLITVSIIGTAVPYLMFGFLGYNKYLTVCDTVIKNLPLNETLAQMVKIGVVLSVAFTFGLVYYVPIDILWPMIQEKQNFAEHYKYVFCFSLIFLTTLLAIAVPKMVPLLGLIAAWSMTTIMLLIPIVMETATYWEEVTTLLIAKNIFIFFIWVLVWIFGSIESMRSIINEFSEWSEVDRDGC